MTCPYHLSLPSLIFICNRFTLTVHPMFLILSFLVTPLANLNIFIPATSISFTCFFVTATISNPYTIAGRRRPGCLKGIHSRLDTNRTGAEGLSFYYPRLLYCLNQMLAVILLSQNQVSSSKTVRSCAQSGARCIGHAVRTLSVVCSEASHSQFGEEARPHLCMDEWNRPTPVRRRLSLIQATPRKPIPTGVALVPGPKARSLEVPLEYFVFHL